jgi:hypothetical protein
MFIVEYAEDDSSSVRSETFRPYGGRGSIEQLWLLSTSIPYGTQTEAGPMKNVEVDY